MSCFRYWRRSCVSRSWSNVWYGWSNAVSWDESSHFLIAGGPDLLELGSLIDGMVVFVPGILKHWW